MTDLFEKCENCNGHGTILGTRGGRPCEQCLGLGFNMPPELKNAGLTQSSAGYLVETKTGLSGRTYHKEDLVRGKMCVHLDNGHKMLCSPEGLKKIGFID